MSKVGQDFLALLVLGVFNVAIGASDIRDDLQHHSQVPALPGQTAEQ